MVIEEDKKERIVKYLQDQISVADFHVHAYIYDEQGNRRPARDAFKKLSGYLTEFYQRNREIRWIILAGLRGAGKTTLLAQLYDEHKKSDVYRLYLSVDQIVQILGVNLYEVLSVYEELIGMSFERLDKPLILFLDEVQYEKKWGIYLKSIYDRTRKVFIMATGSSALNLNTNADVARRAIFERLAPLSFIEYMRLKESKPEPEGLSSELKNIIFKSSSAENVHKKIVRVENEIRRYWLGIERMEAEKYMRYGSLPFMVAMKNESIIYEQIKRNIDRIINYDIANHANFTSEIIVRISAILYAIADSDILGFSKLAERFEMSRPKIMEILDIMEKTETLLRIYPYGSHYSQVNKPSKYLFTSPAFRSMYFNLMGSVKPREHVMGKILEDTVGMYIVKSIINMINISINYDCSKGGADFIVSMGDEKIIIEVGSGEKGFKQVIKTANRIKSKYGLVVSRGRLTLSKEHNAVIIPLEYFLLL